MTKEQVLKIFNIEDLTELPDAVMRVLFSPEKNSIFKELIKVNKGDMLLFFKFLITYYTYYFLWEALPIPQNA